MVTQVVAWFKKIVVEICSFGGLDTLLFDLKGFSFVVCMSSTESSSHHHLKRDVECFDLALFGVSVPWPLRQIFPSSQPVE